MATVAGTLALIRTKLYRPRITGDTWCTGRSGDGWDHHDIWPENSTLHFSALGQAETWEDGWMSSEVHPCTTITCAQRPQRGRLLRLLAPCSSHGGCTPTQSVLS